MALQKLACAICLTTSLTAFAEPINLAYLKTEIRHYHDSGQYEQEVRVVAHEADTYIHKRVEQNRTHHRQEKLAIVLDIDETSLSNYDGIVHSDFTGNRQRIHKHILAANDHAIKPMLQLYRQAIQQGVQVFFVTGRRQSECEGATERNLRQAGFTHWSGLYCRPEADQTRSIVPFKSGIRKQLTKQGYTIIATIGDQRSDLKGGYAEKGFKLPNPFYYLP